MDRRGFFRRIGGRDSVVRPPGATSESVFAEICNHCAACVNACPQSIIGLAANGLPTLDFDLNECIFCGRCVEVCKPGALVAEDDMEASWLLRARVSASCLDKNGITCRACESSCENDAIKFYPALGGRTDVCVQLKDCTGCGACIAACHAGAIAMFRPEINTTTSKEKAA